MILFQEKIINDEEIEILLNLWDVDLIQDIGYFPNGKRLLAMKFLDIVEHKLDISFLHNGAFCNRNFEKLKIQYYHESLGNVSEYHVHHNVHNYIIFLNDDFVGGELEFENGITIKPTKGSLVYLNNNEKHRVLPHIGHRYVFVAFGNTEANIQYKIKKQVLI
jgi:hypothetical protein